MYVEQWVGGYVDKELINIFVQKWRETQLDVFHSQCVLPVACVTHQRQIIHHQSMRFWVPINMIRYTDTVRYEEISWWWCLWLWNTINWLNESKHSWDQICVCFSFHHNRLHKNATPKHTHRNWIWLVKPNRIRLFYNKGSSHRLHTSTKHWPH